MQNSIIYQRLNGSYSSNDESGDDSLTEFSEDASESSSLSSFTFISLYCSIRPMFSGISVPRILKIPIEDLRLLWHPQVSKQKEQQKQVIHCVKGVTATFSYSTENSLINKHLVIVYVNLCTCGPTYARLRTQHLPETHCLRQQFFNNLMFLL